MPKNNPDKNLFSVHVLNSVGIVKANQIQSGFDDFLALLIDICGSEGREMAIVRTKLQEAAFFAKRAMALDASNQGG